MPKKKPSPLLCQGGELCGKTQHVETDDGWVTCSCFYLMRRKRWFLAGGFAEEHLHLTAEEVIAMTGCADRKVTPPYLRKLVRWLMEEPGNCLRLDVSKGLDSFPLASWLAFQLALQMEVMTVRVFELVDLSFQEHGGHRRYMRANTTLVIRGFGDDPRHLYNAPIVLELLQARIERRAPTIIAYTPSAEWLSKEVYGERVHTLLQRFQSI